MDSLRKLSLGSLMLLSACGEPPPGAPAGVTVSTERTPALIAYRDGLDAEWRTPAATATGAYAFDVHGPYVVTVVCEEQGNVTTLQLARTPDDERELALPCRVWSPDPISVIGAMRQPGTVALGKWLTMSSQADWTFDLTTTTAPHDLIASSDERLLIRRDMTFTEPAIMDLDLDLDPQSVAFAPVAFTASNASASEQLDVYVSLATATTAMGQVYFGNPASAKVAPSAILRSTDRQVVWMSASSEDAERSVGRRHEAGGPTGFTLPEPLHAQLSTARGEVVAAWSALPEHDQLLLASYGESAGNFHDHALALSQRFLMAIGDGEAVQETDIPGYLPEWRMDFTKEHAVDLWTSRRAAGESLVSSTRKAFNVPAGAARSKLEEGRRRFDPRRLDR